MRRAKCLRRKMNEIDAYAEARDLPECLRKELTRYYQDVWVAYEGTASLLHSVTFSL